MEYMKSVAKQNYDTLKIAITLAFVLIAMSILSKNFLSLANFKSMAFQFPEIAIFALAIAITLISGGIDLSIVGIANLASILAIYTIKIIAPTGASLSMQVLAICIGVLVSLSVGAICGMLNGVLIAKIGMLPILTTMATMQLFTGISTGLSNGSSVFGLPEIYSYVGSGSVFFIPFPLFILILVIIGVFVYLSKSNQGFKTTLLGTNLKALQFSGANTDKVLLYNYLLSGVLASVAGLIIMGRTISAKADYGNSYTLMALLIAILGGVSPSGGYGKIKGVVISVLTIQILVSGFNHLRLSSYYNSMTFGLILIIIMAIHYRSDGKN